MSHQSAADHVSTFTSKQRTIALVVVAFAFVMDLLDGTIVNIAIPSIQGGLHASYATIQWLVAGYSLSFALLLITGGRMGDVFGYKKVFLTGITGFTIASFLCGISQNPTMLVVARLLQGSMAALMVPQVMSLMQVMYKKNERGKVMGLFGMLGGMAATLGPIIGGFLIEANIFNWSWRPIFLINVPIGILAALAAIKYLPKGKSPHPLRLDLVGTGILVIALSMFVFPLIQGRELEWPMWTFVMLILSVPALVIFAWYERRKDKRDSSALVVPSLFKARTFSSGLALNLVLQLAIMAFFLTFTLTLQAGLGLSALKTAIIGIPTAVGIGSSIAFGQKLVPTLGRYLITVGTLVIAAGFILNAYMIRHYGLSASGWQFAPGLLIGGVGMGCIMSTMFSVTLQDVDPQHAGSASGMMNAIQQVGGAIGIALIGVVFFGHLTSGATKSFDQITPQFKKDLSALHVPIAAQQQIIDSTKTCFHDRSIQKDATVTPKSCQQAMSQSGSSEVNQKVTDVITHSAKSANALNFGEAYKWGTVLSIGVLVFIFALSFRLPRHFHFVEETV